MEIQYRREKRLFLGFFKYLIKKANFREILNEFFCGELNFSSNYFFAKLINDNFMPKHLKKKKISIFCAFLHKLLQTKESGYFLNGILKNFFSLTKIFSYFNHSFLEFYSSFAFYGKNFSFTQWKKFQRMILLHFLNGILTSSFILFYIT